MQVGTLGEWALQWSGWGPRWLVLRSHLEDDTDAKIDGIGDVIEL
jgi:hypothetical protein